MNMEGNTEDPPQGLQCQEDFRRDCHGKHVGNHPTETPFNTEEKLFHCSECNRSFKRKGRLVQHMRTHTGEKFQCSECNSSFIQKVSLLQHMRVHTGEKFQCSECISSFTRKSDLVRHIKVHSGEKFQCSECNSSFTRKSDLVRHMRIHTGEKFQCLECNCSYSKKFDLVQHMRIHTGEKFQCSECNCSYTQKSKLIQHMSIHTGKNPYQCTKCNQSFTHKSQMVSHMKVHIEKFQCCDCQKCFPSKVSLTMHSRTHLTSYSKDHAKVKPFKCHKKCGEKSGSGITLTRRDHHLGALGSHPAENQPGNDLNSPELNHNNCQELFTSCHSKDEYSLSYQCKTKAVCKLAVSGSTHFIDWSREGVKEEPVDSQPSILGISEDPLKLEMVPPSSIKLENLKEEFDFVEEEF